MTGGARDAAMTEKLLHYFGPIVEEARRMERAQARSKEADEPADDEDSTSS